MSSVSGYRGDIVVYTPGPTPPAPSYRPAPPPVYVPSTRPTPPPVSSRPAPPSVVFGQDVHISRRGNPVIRDYATGESTTIVTHGPRAGQVIHQHIK